jgi:hypothetical protein
MDMISGLRYQAEKLRKEKEAAAAKAAGKGEATVDDPGADDAAAAAPQE